MLKVVSGRFLHSQEWQENANTFNIIANENGESNYR